MYEYDISVHPATAFQQLVYFCTSDGECSEEVTVTEGMTAKLTEQLNARGVDGWELIHLVFAAQGIVTFWKRESGQS